jgi:hypothetical protein
MISKLTKWTILDAKNPKNNNVVTPFDDIVLKSAFGFYLHIKDQSDFVVWTGSGSEPNDFSIFRVVKATIPYLPDWLFKRPHLNHNSLS